MINIIAAVSSNGVIGKDNKLPFHYPEDLKHFKKLTLNQTVVMGRKTFDSIGKPLPNRRNMVISASLSNREVEIFDKFNSDILKSDSNVWIIGGSSLYQEAMRYADEIHLTLTPDVVTGENLVKFPWINPSVFSIDSIEQFPADSVLKYAIYKRFNYI